MGTHTGAIAHLRREEPVELRLIPSPLPPLRPAGLDPAPAQPGQSIPEAPSWSPVRAAVALFAVVWACFAFLAGRVMALPDAEVARLGHLLATGTGIVALVLVTLSVAHAQVSGLRPRPAVVLIVVLGAVQGLAAASLGSSPSDLWHVGAELLGLIGVIVPLAWVGGQFQCGVRRQRVERYSSLMSSWIARARHQAHQTVESVQRHDVRSMLFVIDGAARVLADAKLPEAERAAFGDMLTESVARLGSLMDVRTEEIQPFDVNGVVRAVAHAERKAGRTVTADVPAGLTAVGRAADVAAALRTAVTAAGRQSWSGVQVRAETEDGVVVISVEPAGADVLPLLSRNWEEVRAESFKISSASDEGGVDLFVAARLLAEQGADLWSSAGRARFAVRLPTAVDSTSEVAE